jgi:hypothetical protein
MIQQVLEVLMNTYLCNSSAIAATLILAACAATTADVHPKTEASAAVAQNPACLTQTGSRIAGDGKHCSAFGRSYSSTDIDRTGSTTAADALRLLDPSITTRH